MKKIVSIILICIICPLIVCAQDWNGFVSDYRTAIQSYESGDLATSIQALKRMERFRDANTQKGAQSNNSDYCFANSLIGDVYLKRGMEEKGLPILMEAYEFFKTQDNDDYYARVCDICRNLADYYHKIDDKDKAYAFRKEAAEYSKKQSGANDDSKLTYCIDLLAYAQECISYGTWEESLSVIDGFQKVIKTVNKNKLNNNGAYIYDMLHERSLLLLVKTYDNLSGYASYSGDNRNAIKYFNEGYNIAKQSSGLFCSMEKSLLYILEYYISREQNSKTNELIEAFANDYCELNEEPGSKEYRCIACLALIEHSLDINLYDTANTIADYLYNLASKNSIDEFAMAAMEWRSVIARLRGDFIEATQVDIDLIKQSESVIPPDSLKRYFTDAFYNVYNSTTHLRYFVRKTEGSPNSDSFVPVYPEKKIQSAFDQWDWLINHATSLYGADAFTDILSFLDHGEDYRNFPPMTRGDYDDMLSHKALYYKDYVGYLNKVRKIRSEYGLSDDQFVLLLWRSSYNLFLNSSYQEAIEFLREIEPHFASQKDISEWISNEMAYLSNWGNNKYDEKIAKGEVYDLKERIAVHNDILSQVDRSFGQSSQYVDALLTKALDEYESGDYVSAASDFSYADKIIVNLGLNGFDYVFPSLRGQSRSYRNLQQYDKSLAAEMRLLQFLDSNESGETGVNLSKEYYESVLSIFNDYYRLGENKKAQRVIDDAISRVHDTRNQTDLESKKHLYLGLNHYLTGFIDEAISQENYEMAIRDYDRALLYLPGLKETAVDIFTSLCLNLEREKYFISHSGDKKNYVDRIIKLADACFDQSQSPQDTVAYNKALTLYILATACREVGDGEDAVNLFNRANEIMKTIPQMFQEDMVSSIYESLASTYQMILGDWPSALDYHSLCFSRLLQNNDSQSAVVLDEFFDMYLVYKNAIATGTSYVLDWLDDKGHPHFSYEGYISLINKWRNLLAEIKEQQGESYLSLLKEKCTKEESNQLANIFSEIDLFSSSFYDECRVNIRFHRVPEFEHSYDELISSLSSNNTLTPRNIYVVSSYLADELINNGKGDIGYQIFMKCDSIIGATDGSEYDRERGYYSEKITTKMAEYQWSLGNYSFANSILTKTMFTVDEDFRRQMYEKAKENTQDSSWPGEYNNYVETVNKKFPFYDIDEELYQIALLARSTSNSTRRIQYLDYAIRLLDSTSEEDVSADTQAMLYNDYGISIEDTDKQIVYLTKSLSFNPENIGTRINLANALISSKQYEKAEEQIKVIDEYVVTHYVSPRWKDLICKAKTELHIHNGDYQLAREVLKENLEIIESDYLLKTQSLGTVSRESYWDSNYSLTLESINSLECLLGNNASLSYDAALFQKGILINQKRTIRDNIRASKDSILVASYNKYLQGIASGSSTSYEDESEMMYYYAKHPEFVSSFVIDNWESVLSSLGDEEIAIEYSQAVKGDDVYLVALLLKKGLKYPEMQFLCKTDDLLDLLKEQDAYGFSRSYNKKDSNNNYLLYSMIWSPIKMYLKGIKTIYFSAYGPVYNTNIEYLRENENSKYMADLYEIHRVSSTSRIKTLNHRNSAGAATLIGNLDYDYPDTGVSAEVFSTPTDFRGNLHGWRALYDTKKEIDDIYSALVKKCSAVSVFQQSDCSERVFKSLPHNSCNILHIATHGYYFQEESSALLKEKFFNPNEKESIKIDASDRSGLILSGANHAWRGEPISKSNDGILTAGEIEGLEFYDTDLLVLSACQTALGDNGSDGVFGLQRSFKVSGVNTIIMSLWQVNSAATQEMMSAFYDSLSNGKSKYDAFSSAIDHMRKKAPESPELWMPFVMLD